MPNPAIFAGRRGESYPIPNTLTVVGSVTHANLDGARVVDATGTYAYVVAETAGRLTVVDCSTPSAPSVVGSVSVIGGGGSNPTGISKVGNVCYVCVGGAGGGLVSVDVTTPTAPSVLQHLALNSCHSVHAVGSYAYMSRQGAGRFHRVDISNPSSMSVVNTVTTGTTPAGISYSGGVAYMCDNGGAGSLISIDPATGVLNTLAISGAHGVVADGSYAYVSSGSANTITVVNISNPSSMSSAGSVTNANLNVPYYVCKAGPYLYAGGYNVDRVTAVTVTTPASPTSGASVNSSNLDGVLGSVVSGSYIYAASQIADRLTVISIT